MFLEDVSRIGYRGGNKINDPNFGTSKFSLNHQTLQKTKKQITPAKFNSCYKISSIRNPYDRLVSAFHFFENTENSLEEYLKLKQSRRVDEISRRFEDYFESKSPHYNAWQHWYIGSNMLIDKFVRMEYLQEDLNDVFNYLNVPEEIAKNILSNIPKLKDSGRSDTCLNVSDYFTDKTLEAVNERYSDWFSFGGYVKYNTVASFEHCQHTQQGEKTIY